MEATQKSSEKPKPEEQVPSLDSLFNKPVGIAAVAAAARYPSTTKRPAHQPKTRKV